MRAPLAWFAARRGTAAAAIAAYVVLVTWTHDHVQDVAYLLQRTFGAAAWAPFVAAAAIAAALVATVRVFRAAAASPVRREARAAWGATLLLSAAAFGTFLATNMEVVHFLQYSILAVPALALAGRFAPALLLVTAAGAFDEAWQYAVLHMGWGVPYDVNDVVLNALGASFGLAALLCTAEFRRRDDAAAPTGAARAWVPCAAASAVLLVAGPLLVASGRIALHPGEAEAPWIVLARCPRPERRWESPDWGRGHLVLHPGAAAAIVCGLAAGWTVLDRRVAWTGGGARP
jgi:hypothetical protein